MSEQAGKPGRRAGRRPAFDGKRFARELTAAPGVYRMLAADGSVLYVGKAASLKKRVASYFVNAERSPRQRAMLAQVAAMEVTVTRTEGEALLLENQLIKSLKPRYNVLLRDDKSYPYIHVSTEDEFPRISFHRGRQALPGRYFGPYPSASVVRETLNTIHRLFKLRSCEDSVFRNRSRPCLQYQIGRCSAPCVGYTSAEAYRASVRRAVLFLEGNDDVLVEELTREMGEASAALEFERAARLRDQIANLRSVQAEQYVDGQRVDMDVLACVVEDGVACVVMMCFRNGMNRGTRNHFPRTNGVEDPAEILAAFVSQYYADSAPPAEVILSHRIPEQRLIEQGLGERFGRHIRLTASVRTKRARYLELTLQNARIALATRVGSQATRNLRLEALRELLGLAMVPQRIECFDVSHTMGEAMVAACVVFDAEGPQRGQYRRYNISGVTPGDDPAAMHQALERRFRRAAEDGIVPDVLLIDGGRAQLDQALAVLNDYGIHELSVLAVSQGVGKRAGNDTLVFPLPPRHAHRAGVGKRAGNDTLVFPDGRSLHPGPASPALHLIAEIRDEAHRFAITGHRGRRARRREHSRLEDIPGIGARRRAMLLRHFGGLAELRRAGAEEIARVDGISMVLAQRVWSALHGVAGESADRAVDETGQEPR